MALCTRVLKWISTYAARSGGGCMCVTRSARARRYEMRGELCAGVPVTIGRVRREWSRAMKCMLTNLKWLLAWAYRQER